jgi:hypothetical protein
LKKLTAGNPKKFVAFKNTTVGAKSNGCVDI